MADKPVKFRVLTWPTLETSAEPIVVALRGAAEAADASSAAPNAPSAMAFMAFSLRLGETIDLYDAAFRNSTLASNILLPPTLLELWRASRPSGLRLLPGS